MPMSSQLCGREGPPFGSAGAVGAGPGPWSPEAADPLLATAPGLPLVLPFVEGSLLSPASSTSWLNTAVRANGVNARPLANTRPGASCRATAFCSSVLIFKTRIFIRSAALLARSAEPASNHDARGFPASSRPNTTRIGSAWALARTTTVLFIRGLQKCEGPAEGPCVLTCAGCAVARWWLAVKHGCSQHRPRGNAPATAYYHNRSQCQVEL